MRSKYSEDGSPLIDKLYYRISSAMLGLMKENRELSTIDSLPSIYLKSMLRRYVVASDPTSRDIEPGSVWFTPSIFELRHTKSAPLPWKIIQDPEVAGNRRVMAGNGAIVAINLSQEQADALVHFYSLPT
jgi:hypothetical protein